MSSAPVEAKCYFSRVRPLKNRHDNIENRGSSWRRGHVSQMRQDTPHPTGDCRATARSCRTSIHGSPHFMVATFCGKVGEWLMGIYLGVVHVSVSATVPLARWACLRHFPCCQLSEFSVLFSFKGPHPPFPFFTECIADPFF